MGRMFADKTGLRLGDMGVVVYKDRWTPVLIADGGPFMRLGEGSEQGLPRQSAKVAARSGTAMERGLRQAGTRFIPTRISGSATMPIFIRLPRQPELRSEAGERHLEIVCLCEGEAQPDGRRNVPVIFPRKQERSLRCVTF